MKFRLFGVLAIVGCVGVLATAALAAQAQQTKTITVGVSLAGYSTDFWSSFVQFE